MKNKTAIFALAAVVAPFLAPSAQAGNVVIRFGGSVGFHAPAVCAPPVCAAPVVTYVPSAPVYYSAGPVVYARPYYAPGPVAYVGPYVPPSARFGYGYGLYGRTRYCGWW